MTGLETNPFAILTFMAAPAILTNASSVLALGTSNRFARNIDRARVLIRLIEGKGATQDAEAAMQRRLLGWMELRSGLLVRALTCFYFAIGSFAAGSLTSLLGASVAPLGHGWLLMPILVVALVTGIAGLLGLIIGGTLLVRETRLALRTIHEEAAFYRSRYPLGTTGESAI
jgi:hypothetical protein